MPAWEYLSKIWPTMHLEVGSLCCCSDNLQTHHIWYQKIWSDTLTSPLEFCFQNHLEHLFIGPDAAVSRSSALRRRKNCTFFRCHRRAEIRHLWHKNYSWAPTICIGTLWKGVVFQFLAPTGALEEGILSVRPCVCYFSQKNMEKEF